MRKTMRRKLPKTTWVLPVTLLLVSGLAGCAVQLGGGSSKTVVEASVGQELADLKAAHEAGIITAEEYEALKKAVMER